MGQMGTAIICNVEKVISWPYSAVNQTAIAEQIVAGGRDYVLAVKDNQPQLTEALRDFFTTLNAPGPATPSGMPPFTRPWIRRGHGRIESRRSIAVASPIVAIS